MKIGEIKKEALRLMFSAVGDEEIAVVEGDAELAVYLSAMTGSINRALGDLEMRRVLPLQRRMIAPDEWEIMGDVYLMTPPPEECPYEAVRLLRTSDGSELPLGFEGGVLTTRGLSVGEPCVLIYRPHLRRISPWENDGELEGVPNEVAALIPYFIKGELFREDDPNEAGEARNWYEAALERLGGLAEERSMDAVARVQSVYAQVAL